MIGVMAYQDGRIEPVVFNGFESMQNLVDGWIQMVKPHALPMENISIVINEEGKLRGMKLNQAASLAYETQKHGDPIVGNALFVQEEQTEDGPVTVTMSDETMVEVIGFLIQLTANGMIIM